MALDADFNRVVLQYLIGPLQSRADDVGEIGGSTLPLLSSTICSF
jgi:hypothetical protein